MDNQAPVTTLPLHLDEALALVALQFVANGLYVAKSFEIDSSCAPITEQICPHRGTGPCECRLSVLQVHDEETGSLHLVLHGYEEKTEFFIDPQESSGCTDFEYRVKRLLLEENDHIHSLIGT